MRILSFVFLIQLSCGMGHEVSGGSKNELIVKGSATIKNEFSAEMDYCTPLKHDKPIYEKCVFNTLEVLENALSCAK